MPVTEDSFEDAFGKLELRRRSDTFQPLASQIMVCRCEKPWLLSRWDIWEYEKASETLSGMRSFQPQA